MGSNIKSTWYKFIHKMHVFFVFLNACLFLPVYRVADNRAEFFFLFFLLTHKLKYVSKLKAHFVKMANIFRSFNGMCDFTFAMHSHDHEDNFQL